MNIDFSAKEYFEQLQLMETHYVQEEALYPWIYMLLQAADNKMKELPDDYEGVFVNDVHNGHGGNATGLNGSCCDVKEFLDNKRPYPDFVVFESSDNGHCLGCVEIKKLGSNYIKQYNDVINSYGYYRIRFFDKEGQRHIGKIDETAYKKLKGKKFEIVWVDNKIKVRNETTEEFDIEDMGADKKINFQKPLVYKIWEFEKECNPFEKFIDINDINEMMSHIRNYKKVLYTNGLQFCLITCMEEKTDEQGLTTVPFKVEELANFQEQYSAYKKSEYLMNLESEWEKLKWKLCCIKWGEETIKIPYKNKI